MMGSNRPDEAIKLYDRALSLNPQYAHALFDKGQALKEKGDAKGATEAFQRFLALVPSDSDDAKRVKDGSPNWPNPVPLRRKAPGQGREQITNTTSAL